MRYRVSPRWPSPPPEWQPSLRWSTRDRVRAPVGWQFWDTSPQPRSWTRTIAVVGFVVGTVLMVVTVTYGALLIFGPTVTTVTFSPGTGSVTEVGESG